MILFDIEKIFTRDEFLLLCNIMKPPAKLNLRTFYADIANGIPKDYPETIDITIFLEKLAKIHESELVIILVYIQNFLAVREAIDERERLQKIGLRYSTYVSKPVPDDWQYSD